MIACLFLFSNVMEEFKAQVNHDINVMLKALKKAEESIDSLRRLGIECELIIKE